jgi:hypothetical protein
MKGTRERFYKRRIPVDFCRRERKKKAFIVTQFRIRLTNCHRGVLREDMRDFETLVICGEACKICAIYENIARLII